MSLSTNKHSNESKNERMNELVNYVAAAQWALIGYGFKKILSSTD